VAWCAFEAWCEGDDEEYQFWLGIFHRLRNSKGADLIDGSS